MKCDLCREKADCSYICRKCAMTLFTEVNSDIKLNNEAFKRETCANIGLHELKEENAKLKDLLERVYTYLTYELTIILITQEVKLLKPEKFKRLEKEVTEVIGDD